MFVTIDPPPGVVREGTEYKSKGRFYDCNHWRWFAGTSGPTGGWTEHSTSAVSGRARAITAWRDNDGFAWAAIGTHTGLYAMTRSGALYDITPDDFVTGRADAVSGSGFGSGTFGTGLFGVPRSSSYEVLDADVWSLDTWGEHLVGVMPKDGVIYTWQLDVGLKAEAVDNAPTAKALVVTADRIMMALGANGDPRAIHTSQQGDNTVWTTTVDNYARQQTLQTPGRLVCGKRINGGTLLFTDVDVWLATFLGQPLVYGYTKAGTGCGVISPQCVALTDASVFWMSKNGFWSYNGFTQPLACDVHDHVFGDINLVQASKVFALHNSSFGEVTWFYCSSESTEINRYVTFNYREGHWSIGAMTRLAGVEDGVFTYPMLIGMDGVVYDHERGWDHGGATPYAQTGPMEIGEGDHLMMVRRIIPDERAQGDVEVTFQVRGYPTSTAVVRGPYSLGAKTDVRFSGRQVSVTYTGNANDAFQVGAFRFEIGQRGARR